MTAPRVDFRPVAAWEILRRRAELLSRLRSFFAQRGFLEVETPLLSADTVCDVHLDPLVVRLFDDARRPDQGPILYLQTSPEFAMKRLMAAGGEAIYQVCKAFRGGERGPRHNPEFTMVEWYRAGEGYAAGMQFLSDLVDSLLRLGPAEQITFAAAFERFVGVDPHSASVEQFAAAAARHGLAAVPSMTSAGVEDWRNWLLAELVEPHLGVERPAILHDYPVSQAALAAVLDDGRRPVAQRFELYVRGIELANGYRELLDANVLRDRNAQAASAREEKGVFALPQESRLLAAMDAGLPPCTGCALGFDRLVMIAVGASRIDDVLAFPSERA